MSDDTKNLVLAIGLSLLVIIGWNWFYGVPQMNKAHQAQTQQAAASAPGAAPNATTLPSPAAAPENPGLPAGGNLAAEQQSRAKAVQESPRVAIATKSLSGSISLRGGMIDDVSLNAYRETTDPDSPHIVLLSPPGSANPYYVQLGFVSKTSGLALPDANTLWSADAKTLTVDKPVTLTWDNGHGLIFHRQIAVDDRYMFTVADSVENKTGAPVTLSPYSLIARVGQPKPSGYAVIFEGFLGYIGGQGLQEITYDKIEKDPNQSLTLNGVGGWLGFADKYWATALIPSQNQQFTAQFLAYGASQKIYQTDALGGALTIQPGATGGATTRVFAGAKEVNTIDRYESSLHILKFNLMIDWGWFWFITQPLFQLLDLIYHFVGNFGLAIMIVTVLIKGLFFPLANRSYLSMAKMKGVQPQIAALRERYPDDKQKQQLEMMELYKREKINPIAGCWPMLLQVPVFFALYKVIFTTIEMRQAPFFGWIHDLSAPDPTNIFTLFGLIPWDPTQLPVFGHFLAIGIWPMIMGCSMFLQMKMNPEPPDPVQKQMFTWMPVIFTFMLGTFPAGLVIYWTWNNTLSVTQQYIIMRRAGVKVELWDNLRGLFKKKSGAVA
jgi:YidC/Oxa1 family membrane protein insertase